VPRVVCPRCLACFGDGDAVWERAVSERACPYCARPLDVRDPAVQFDVYKSDPTPPLVRRVFLGIGLVAVFALGVALVRFVGTMDLTLSGVAKEVLSWPITALGLAITVVWLLPGRHARAYRGLACIALLCAFGAWIGWFTWPVATLLLLPFAGVKFLRWLGQPIRHRGRRFEDFQSFLGPWAESFDRGASIFIEPEAPRTPRLRFRLAGRGLGKKLKVRLLRRRASEAELRSQLDGLVAMFSEPAIRERKRSFELSLPADAPYTGSVAARAAEAAFTALGCTNESTFTIYGEGGRMDPYYALRLAERLAERLPSGFWQRYFDAHARRLRATLPKQRRPRTPRDL